MANYKLTPNLKEKWKKGIDSSKNHFLEKSKKGVYDNYIRNIIF